MAKKVTLVYFSSTKTTKKIFWQWQKEWAVHLKRLILHCRQAANGMFVLEKMISSSLVHQYTEA